MTWHQGPRQRAHGPDFQRSHLPGPILKRLVRSGREVSAGASPAANEPNVEAEVQAGPLVRPVPTPR